MKYRAIWDIVDFEKNHWQSINSPLAAHQHNHQQQVVWKFAEQKSTQWLINLSELDAERMNERTIERDEKGKVAKKLEKWTESVNHQRWAVSTHTHTKKRRNRQTS